MREQEAASPVGVGVIAIITILLVLILSIFSCLTLATAQGDYALAQRGAETVTSYYEADGQARQLRAAFMEGEEDVLEVIVPMDQMQGLRIHLQRGPDGEAVVLAWQTVLLEDFSRYSERPLPVWSGE